MRDLPVAISEWLLLRFRAQRAVAHLLVDPEQVLVTMGGALEHYGLTELQPQHPACEQLPFLEGLLPLQETPFLLPCVEMPSGRVADIHFLVQDRSTRIVLLDVTAERDESRKILQKANDMTLLSEREARLVAKLEAAHKDLTVAHRELAESREALLQAHRRLQHELRDAERYVRAILPAPMTEPLAIDWRFIPSVDLGGDAFGYHWIDGDHLAMYLLDVCGHGLKAALLSISAINVLRNQTLPATDFRRPAQVLAGMNDAFQMERHDGMFFTLWYGVYERSSRQLSFSSGGHPPAVLIADAAAGISRRELRSDSGMLIGAFPATIYNEQTIMVPEFSRLYLFSDGIYEIPRPGGTAFMYEEIVDILSALPPTAPSAVEEAVGRIRAECVGGEFEDDASIIEVTF
jgi:serine phosphatase RsbU (regulator of sigma subunit)